MVVSGGADELTPAEDIYWFYIESRPSFFIPHHEHAITCQGASFHSLLHLKVEGLIRFHLSADPPISSSEYWFFFNQAVSGTFLWVPCNEAGFFRASLISHQDGSSVMEWWCAGWGGGGYMCRHPELAVEP